MSSSARLLAAVLVSTVVACASTANDAGSPSRANDAESTQPTETGTNDPTAPGDPGTPDAGGTTSRARCGATPYEWVVSSALGDVLESRNLAPHTPFELNLGLLQARESLLKTRRTARYSTKSKVVRYVTQDRGKILDATAAVAWPDVGDAKTFPVLLVLHGTAGFADSCSPSGSIPDDTIAAFQNETAILLSLFASFGYVVVAPDYLGLKSMGTPTGFLHPYLVAEPTAIASLDSVRAAKKLLAGSNIAAGDVVVIGGSQGGHAAAFVNRYQPHYAPELVIKGSVWDVPPTDLLGQSVPALTTDTNATKNVMAATTALESWYRSAPNGLAEAFNAPWNTSIPEAMKTECSPNAVLAGASLETVFTPAYRSAGREPGFGGLAPWDCYMKENSLPTTSVPKLDDVPSLFLLGENDDLVDNTVERAAFQTLCSQGHVLQFLECSEATHTKPLMYAFDQWIDFLEDRLAGKPVTDACVVRPAERCTSQP